MSSGDIHVSSGQIDVGSKASISSDGHIKASGGIVRIYTKTASFWTVVPQGAYSILSMMSCDATTHTRLSCSFTTSNSVAQADSVLTDNSCALYVSNLNTTGSRDVTPNITCFDPNGTW